MEKFASTDTLMQMLINGEYKRPVMENEESSLDISSPEKAEKTFEAAFEAYKEHVSHPDNYDYLARRQVQ